jgi:hypothetical protein
MLGHGSLSLTDAPAMHTRGLESNITVRIMLQDPCIEGAYRLRCTGEIRGLLGFVFCFLGVFFLILKDTYDKLFFKDGHHVFSALLKQQTWSSEMAGESRFKILLRDTTTTHHRLSCLDLPQALFQLYFHRSFPPFLK